jgi:hypothetical protein
LAGVLNLGLPDATEQTHTEQTHTEETHTEETQ